MITYAHIYIYKLVCFFHVFACGSAFLSVTFLLTAHEKHKFAQKREEYVEQNIGLEIKGRSKAVQVKTLQERMCAGFSRA